MSAASLPPSETVHDVLDAALEAYAALELLGEDIEDEWTYVTELESAWRARLLEVDAVRGEEPAPDHLGAAFAAAIEEIGAIEDPHRAIDWLSTFPQVLLVALGEPT